MSKILSITVPEWIYDSYLSNLKNRSAFITEMIIKGVQVEDNTLQNTQMKILSLNKELLNLTEKNNIFKRRLAKYDDSKRDPDIIEQEKQIDSLKAGRFFDDP